MSGIEFKKVANIPKNAIAPFKTGLLFMGSAEYVALEVVVDMMVRMIMGSFVRGVSRRSVADLVAIHSLSLPLVGGAAGAFEAVKDEDSGVQDQFMDGAKGVLGMFLAQYVYGMTCKGFYVPRPNITDAIISAAAKTLTRPLNATIATYAPVQMKQAINAVTQVVRAQQKQSQLGDAKTKLG